MSNNKQPLGWGVWLALGALGLTCAAIADMLHAQPQQVVFFGITPPLLIRIFWRQIVARFGVEVDEPDPPRVPEPEPQTAEENNPAAVPTGQALAAEAVDETLEEDAPEVYEDSIVVTTEAQLKTFLKRHCLQDTIFTKVKGVTFRNDDGTDRQTILARCYPGAPVEIQEYSWHGDPAYKVVSEFGQIGVLSADLAQRISSRYGDNVIFQATIDAVTGGYKGLSFGCNLCVRIFL